MKVKVQEETTDPRLTTMNGLRKTINIRLLVYEKKIDFPRLISNKVARTVKWDENLFFQQYWLIRTA